MIGIVLFFVLVVVMLMAVQRILEAEAGKLDSVETRWEIDWAWRLERNP